MTATLDLKVADGPDRQCGARDVKLGKRLFSCRLYRKGRFTHMLSAGLVFLGVLASGVNAAPAVPLDVLRDLSGQWNGIGTLRDGARAQRVDCSLEINWSEDERRLEQRLRCSGSSSAFDVSGTLVALAGHPVLSGHVTMTNVPGGAFAHSEFRGRALYMTIVARGTTGEDALLLTPDTSLWILVLNRGDRRLSSVIRKPVRTGASHEMLSLSLARRSGKSTIPVVAPDIAAAQPMFGSEAPVISREFVEPPISR